MSPDINPGGGVGFVIQSVYAYLSVADDGDEGLIGAVIGDTFMPLVAADQARLIDLRPFAENVARQSGRRVKLVRFTLRSDLEVIEP